MLIIFEEKSRQISHGLIFIIANYATKVKLGINLASLQYKYLHIFIYCKFYYFLKPYLANSSF